MVDDKIRKRLKDILTAIEDIESFLELKPKEFEVFRSDRMFRSAVLYNVAVIGKP